MERIIGSMGNSGCGSPTRIIFTLGRQAQQAAEGAQRFGDALVGLQETEDADERGRARRDPAGGGRHCGRPAESRRRAG